MSDLREDYDSPWKEAIEQYFDFGKRMYVYHYRLFDKYEWQIVSLAVLGDERANWRPTSYDYSLWDCEMLFKFPIVKLLDYEGKWEILDRSNNP